MATKYQIITKQDTGETWNPITCLGEAVESDPVVLGSKGAGLNEMVKLGLPVPDGFTIHTEACVAYQLKPKGTYWRISSAAKRAYKELKKRNGGVAPIVSVRSGAAKSMPGMLSTVANVGLTSKTFPKLAKRFGDRAAFDCKRRLLQSYGTVVLGIPSEHFELELQAARENEEVDTDGELSAAMLEHLSIKFAKVFAHFGHTLPDTIEEQLTTAIRAVFESWNNAEAIHWRKMHGIAEDGGTAVNVQTMVFGNVNDKSGTGVLFTRDPATGQRAAYGEWMQNAQGEDLVAGVRTPQPVSEMKETAFSKAYSELLTHADLLEKTYRDMRDIEFTVEDGKLWMLQDRTGKRSDEAAVRIAVDMVGEDVLTKAEAISRVPASVIGKLRATSKETVSPDWTVPAAAEGLPASPGIVTGRIAKTAAEAIELSQIGPVIMVRHHTETSDLAGMEAAVGILTATGGVTSHAAVVSRSLNTSCIVGCEGIAAAIDLANPTLITLDGSTGKVWFDAQVPVEVKGPNANVEALLEWVFEELDVQRQTTELTGARQRVMCAAWQTDQELKLRSLDFLADASSPETVVFDLSGPERFGREEDLGLTTMFGEDVTAIDDSAMHSEISALANVNGRGAMVYLPGALTIRGEELQQAGYKVALEVSTMADLYGSDGLITIEDETIEKIFGNHSALLQTAELMKNNGTPVEILQPATSESEIIEKYFGKEV